MRDNIAAEINAMLDVVWDGTGKTKHLSTALANVLQDLGMIWSDNGEATVRAVANVYDKDHKSQIIGKQKIDAERTDEVFMLQFSDSSVIIGTDHSIITVTEPVSW